MKEKKRADRFNIFSSMLVLIILFSFVILVSPSVSSIPIELSDQGTDVRSAGTGNKVVLGNLTVEIMDATTNGNRIWSNNFTNAIKNGSWNVMLGESSELNLEFGTKYWKNYKINNEDINFTDAGGSVVDTIEFYAPLGIIESEDVNFTNLNISGPVQIGNNLNMTGHNITAVHTISNAGASITFTDTLDIQSNVKITEDLNVTGTSYLGDIIINSDNITTAAIVAKAGDDNNLTFYNATGQTIGKWRGDGQLQVWDSDGGANDYVSIYHDGTDSFIKSGSGVIQIHVGSGVLVFDNANLYKANANTGNLGAATQEWLSLYLGEDASSGVYFGLDQDARMYYNTSDTIWNQTSGEINIMTPKLKVWDDAQGAGDYVSISHDAIDTRIVTGSGKVKVIGTEFQVWDDAEGSNDYVQIYHDGAQGYIKAGTGGVYLGDATAYVSHFTGTSINPNGANAKDLGATTLEWRGEYIAEGDKSGIFFGLDQDARLYYNTTDTIWNQTSGEIHIMTPALKVWDDAQGANDYIEIYHDGSHGYMDIKSGALALFYAGTNTYSFDSDSINPTSALANTVDVGSTTQEWQGLYLGEDAGSGIYFGLDQDWHLMYDEASQNTLFLNGTGLFEIRNETAGSSLFIVDTDRNKTTVHGDFNVTGTSYLGSVTLTSDNITVNNLVSKDGNISFYNNVNEEVMKIRDDGTIKVNGSMNISGFYSKCPDGEMAYIDKLGGYCIDKYEASVWNPDGTWNTTSNESGWDGATKTDDCLTVGCYAGSSYGKYPWVYIDQTKARTACSNHPSNRKHLCTAEEWMGAADIKGQIYNLPATITDCTIDETRDCDWADAPGGGDACLTGSKADCVSAQGVYDITGNVLEWTNETVNVVVPNGQTNRWHYINTTSMIYGNVSSADNGRYGLDGTYFGTAGSRSVCRGGYWAYEATAGPFCAHLYNAPSNSHSSIGFRCCAAPN